MRSFIRRLRIDSSATTAVEFAFIAPILLMLLFGIIGYGHAFGVYHGVQQLAAEAARASVAGLDDAERERLARDFITRSIGSYAFLEPNKLTVRTSALGAPSPSFEVTVVYDYSDSIFNRLSSIVALPMPIVERRAVVQRGGY
ncbi:MAG: pilus assembly protein [Bosea sp.]|uniref:TadE/TadG family type IV pilus assembly protein n=1 Tax=Bosea sp. (in: a-proteobacteria) TaxID=1871050 RepID=UPI0023A31914|nr:pilus assembly protein [Bosea sp. (in: a-proteobacteria)]MCP4740153.1 pilus assembly protein [Bosea sp. (in: a-proteobacteria)]